MRFSRRFTSRFSLLAVLGAAATSLAVAAPPGLPGSSPGGSSGGGGGTAPLAVAPVVPAGPPRILLCGRPLAVPGPAFAPYRDPVDNVLCVSLEMLEGAGFAYQIGRRAETVTITGPDGRATTVKTRRPPSGSVRLFVPFMEVMEVLGGKCEWEQATNTVHVRALLTGAEAFGGQLRIKTSLPVTATVTNHPARRLIFIEVACAERGPLPKTLPINLPGVAAIRVGQWNDNTARIVIELARPGTLAYSQPMERGPSTTLTLNPLTGAAAVAAGVLPAVVNGGISAAAPPPGLSGSGSATMGGGDPPTFPPAPVAGRDPIAEPNVVNPGPPPVAVTVPPRLGRPVRKPVPAPPPPAVIQSLSLRSTGDNRAQIVIAANRLPDFRTPAATPTRFTLDLRNVRLADAAERVLGNVSHPLLSAVQVIEGQRGAARLVVDLTRIVNYSVSPLTGGGAAGLLIDLVLPRNAGGRLAGKLVVVDPGHGGRASGTQGVNGVYEKHVNLAIGLKLRDELQSLGANVLMIRSGDYDVGLGGKPGQRSYIANQAGADFFISVHADWVRNRAVRGSTVYYHMQVPSCRALAHTIAARQAAMGGVPLKAFRDGVNGVRSDRALHVSGLSVLRESRMVSVLVECGYMSNGMDATLLTQSAMQRKIAGAIANGLRDYVEGNPQRDTRNVNPRPDVPDPAAGITDPASSGGGGDFAAPAFSGQPAPPRRR